MIRVVVMAIGLLAVPVGTAGSNHYGPLDGVAPPYPLDFDQDFGRVLAAGPDYFVTGTLNWTTTDGAWVGAIQVVAPDENGVWRPVAWEEGPEPGIRPPMFGTGLAVSGHRFVVGALRADFDGPNDNGQAYVYRFDPVQAHIEQTHVIDRPEPEVANFGTELGLDGDWLAIGASRTGTFSDGGAVYVYRWYEAAADWQLHQTLGPPDFDQQEVDRNSFGQAVTLHYPWLLVYASTPYLEAEDGSGALYVFRHDTGTDEWQFHQKLTDDPELNFIGAGRSPFTNGEWLLFRSEREMDSGAYHGYLHVYYWDQTETEWRRETVIEGPREQADGYFRTFGYSALIREDNLYISHQTARLRDGSGEGMTRGVVWRYERDTDHPDGWRLAEAIEAPYRIEAPYTNPSDSFGQKVALLGNDQLLISAPSMPLYGFNRIGMVWRYGPNAPPVQLSWSDAGIEGEAVTGEPFTQLLRIDNGGDTAATNIRFHFTHHPELSLVDANVDCWVETGGEQRACLIPQVPADGHFILELDLESEHDWTFDISADMQSDQIEQAPEDRAGQWSITVAEAPSGGGGGSGSGCSLGRGPWELLLFLMLALLGRRYGGRGTSCGHRG